MDHSNAQAEVAETARFGVPSPGYSGRYANRAADDQEAIAGSQMDIDGHNDHQTPRRIPSLSQLNIPALPPPSTTMSATRGQTSPAHTSQKHVKFVHILDNGDRGRLPLTTKIRPHDSTQTIIDAVRSFFGLVWGGLGFEDETGSQIIPSYENFAHDSTVYLRSKPEVGVVQGQLTPEPATQSPTKTFPMLPPTSVQPLSRTTNRMTDASPLGPGFEYTPQLSPIKQADFGASPETNEWLMRLPDGSIEDHNPHSGSKIASADISSANIVDGGRRKRAKFDTQDLPLFQPMQVPSAMSMSSASPIRRPAPQSTSAYTENYALSQTDTVPAFGNGRAGTSSHRNSISYPPSRRRGVLPTPDHTTMSAMSDEDVAWQLVNLSEIGRISSTHGRTSTSTVDDAYSGKANVSDAEDGYSQDESVEQARRDRRAGYNGSHHGPPNVVSRNGSRREADGESSEEDYEDDTSFKGASSEMSGVDHRKKSVSSMKSSKSHKSHKPAKAHSTGKTKVKSHASSKAPPSPRSLSASSRKMSNASMVGFTAPMTPLGPDETDLSSKPRCQRCRKSKKGCDRQRPCGRCKDAGLGIDDCVSEEEGNGKKGRYGRHMGVSIKKGDKEEKLQPQPHHQHQHHHQQPQLQQSAPMPQFPPNPYTQKSTDDAFILQQQHALEGLSAGMSDKNKKRKR